MKTLLPALAAAVMLAAPAPAKVHTRQIFVQVRDQQGAPVLDIAQGDFDVKEAGVVRQVTRAGLATSPMRIALLVDTSDAAAAALTHVRAGLVEFIDALPPEHEVLLVSTGRQMRVRVPPTTDRKKLRETAGGLFPDGAGTVLTDGLLEIDDRFMRKGEDRWPVFVIVTSDGTESSAGAHEKEFNQWAVALGARGATVHALVLKVGKGGGVPDVVAMNLTQNTGGRFDMMNTSNSIPEKLKTLATQIAGDHKAMGAWYRLEFQTDSADFRPIDVGVARSGVRLQISDRRRIQ